MKSKTHHIAACWLSLATAFFTLQSVAQAGPKSSYKYCGETDTAVFVSVNGTIQSWVTVRAYQQITQTQPVPRQTTTRLEVYLTQYDVNTYEFLRQAYGTVDGVAFRAQGNLNSDTVEGTVPLFDYTSGGTFNVTVRLTWAGTGAINRTVYTTRDHYFEQISLSRVTGMFRLAQASGFVNDGATNLAPGLSEPGYSDMVSIESGSLTIIKP